MNILAKNNILTLILFFSVLGTVFVPYYAHAVDLPGVGSPTTIPGGFNNPIGNQNPIFAPTGQTGTPAADSGAVSGSSAGSAAASISACFGGGAIGGGIAGSAAAATFAVPVADSVQSGIQSSQLSKECVLDSIVIALRETLTRKITSSIVTWINTGFEGSPAFVSNIDQYLLDTADEAFGTYIYNASNFAHVCSPFEFDIRFALALSYSANQSRPACTLSDIVENVDTAIDDLSVEWDWDVFGAVATEPGGNRFSSYIQAQEDITNFITGEVEREEDDINRGDGFLSFKQCTDSNAQEAKKEDCQIVSPGSIINDALSNQLYSDQKRLGLADEFNEIVGALIGQLGQQAFGGGGGISGLSKRSGSSDSFLNRYNQDAQGASATLAGDIANANTAPASEYTAYINTQNQSIEELLSAKIKVTEVLSCYNSKYNTWFDSSDEIIAPDDVNSVAVANRTRASFVVPSTGSGLSFNFETLTPAQSLEKVQEYTATLARIDQDLLTAEQNVQNAQEAITATAQYQRDIVNTSNPLRVQELRSDYLADVQLGTVDITVAQAAFAAVEAYTNGVLNGTPTFIDGSIQEVGGAINDLETCQAFSRAVPTESLDEGVTIDS